MCNCINEAEKMIEENNILILDSDNIGAKTFISEQNDTLQELIERLEKQPQEPSLEELLEEMGCGIFKYGNLWYAHKIIDLRGEIEVEGKTPREALLALKEKLK